MYFTKYETGHLASSDWRAQRFARRVDDPFAIFAHSVSGALMIKFLALCDCVNFCDGFCNY